MGKALSCSEGSSNRISALQQEVARLQGLYHTNIEIDRNLKNTQNEQKTLQKVIGIKSTQLKNAEKKLEGLEEELAEEKCLREIGEKKTKTQFDAACCERDEAKVQLMVKDDIIAQLRANLEAVKLSETASTIETESTEPSSASSIVSLSEADEGFGTRRESEVVMGGWEVF